MCLIGLGEAKSQARLDLRGPNHRLKSMVCASTRPRKLRETVIESSCDRLFHHGMTQRPAVLEDLIFVLFGVPEVESGLETDERDFSWDFRFDFFQNFEAVLYDVFYCPFREVVHLLSADSEKSLPGELVDTLHPRLFTGKECDAGSLFRGQKIIKRKVGTAGVAKIPGRFHLQRANSFSRARPSSVSRKAKNDACSPSQLIPSQTPSESRTAKRL